MTPDELLNIMSAAIVTTGNLKNPKVKGTPELVAFRLDTMFKGQPAAANSPSIPVYNLVNTDSQMTGFKAYVCPYEQGKTFYTWLGSGADFMFTPSMNGCTFGIGIPNAAGDVLVCHSNSAKSGGGTPPDVQALVQRHLVEQVLSEGGLILEPKDYRTIGKEQATTFGIRRAGGWEFCVHTYLFLGQHTFKAGGTSPINGGRYALEPAW